jgi:hypothetical protein
MEPVKRATPNREPATDELHEHQQAGLEKAVDKFVHLIERVSVPPEEMIQSLDSGSTVFRTLQSAARHVGGFV